ncbi:hypothetical protein ABW19_dt0206936 [Dactylella cylindrospora]|nr:hypothetical protein ABW19_dt0206936 [Dactylella cylindrospora]
MVSIEYGNSGGASKIGTHAFKSPRRNITPSNSMQAFRNTNQITKQTSPIPASHTVLKQFDVFCNWAMDQGHFPPNSFTVAEWFFINQYMQRNISRALAAMLQTFGRLQGLLNENILQNARSRMSMAVEKYKERNVVSAKGSRLVEEFQNNIKKTSTTQPPLQNKPKSEADGIRPVVTHKEPKDGSTQSEYQQQPTVEAKYSPTNRISIHKNGKGDGQMSTRTIDTTATIKAFDRERKDTKFSNARFGDKNLLPSKAEVRVGAASVYPPRNKIRKTNHSFKDLCATPPRTSNIVNNKAVDDSDVIFIEDLHEDLQATPIPRHLPRSAICGVCKRRKFSDKYGQRWCSDAILCGSPYAGIVTKQVPPSIFGEGRIKG